MLLFCGSSVMVLRGIADLWVLKDGGFFIDGTGHPRRVRGTSEQLLRERTWNNSGCSSYSALTGIMYIIQFCSGSFPVLLELCWRGYLRAILGLSGGVGGYLPCDIVVAGLRDRV